MEDIKYIAGLVLSGIIILTALIVCIFEKRKLNKEKYKFENNWLKEARKKFEEESYSKQKELAETIQEKEQYITSLENNAHNELEKLKNQRLNIEKEISEKSEFNASLLRIREEELERVLKEKKIILQTRIQSDINNWAKSAQEAAEFRQSQIFKDLQVEIDEKDEELRNLQMEVNEFRSKRNAINEEIMRARAIEEKQDFYRIQIPDGYRHDIELLNEIRSQFSKIEILDKLIYDCYIKKPVDEMVKRVLEGRAPSGIYKITRLKTGEVYIGRSSDVKARLQQHCKTCYHCGTISRSTLHEVMDRDKIWNFTFELLEEVPKEKLGEREKYWINFYDSKKFGLNEKNGG